MEKDRLRVLSDITRLADFFFEKDFSYDPHAVEKRLEKDYVCELFEKIKHEITQVESLTKENLEEILRRLAHELHVSTSKIFHPVRVALTGKMTGPGLFELAEILGKQEVIRRIERAQKIAKR